MEYRNYDINPNMGSRAAQFETEQTLSAYVSRVMRKVYVKMFLALLVTALAAWFTASSEAMLNIIFGNKIVFWGLMIAEFGIVIMLSARINKISTSAATTMFYLYAVINGVVFSSIFLAFAPMAIFKTFLITSVTFGAMAVFGYTTKQDLSKFGTILSMCLIGLIIAIVVNIFLKSENMDWIISIVGVVIFVGLTAWDTQRIKEMALTTGEDNAGKLATMGALSLYLDFINLFLYLLRLFGRDR